MNLETAIMNNKKMVQFYRFLKRLMKQWRAQSLMKLWWLWMKMKANILHKIMFCECWCGLYVILKSIKFNYLSINMIELRLNVMQIQLGYCLYEV